MRLLSLVLLLCLALAGWSIAPKVAVWREGDTRWLAAVDGKKLHLAKVLPTGVKDAGAMAAPGVTTLAVVDGGLLGVQGTRLLRLELAGKRWQEIGAAPAAVRELLPAPAGGCYLLTGTGGPVLDDGAVWWMQTQPFACTRVDAIATTDRPWRLWWAGTHLAVATIASVDASSARNRVACFAVAGATATPAPGASQPERPLLDVACATLHADGTPRLVVVEESGDGGKALGFYAPGDTGYLRECGTDAVPGLERVAAYTRIDLYAFGHTPAGKPLAWIVAVYDQGYALYPLPAAPPSPEDALLLYNLSGATLTGWWNGRWQSILLAK
jgi:hypothetical protein